MSYLENLEFVKLEPNLTRLKIRVAILDLISTLPPRNKHEEVILLLTMAEYMARKEAILSQAPEFFGMRSTKFRDAIISYDLTAIALSRVRSFRLVLDLFHD